MMDEKSNLSNFCENMDVDETLNDSFQKASTSTEIETEMEFEYYYEPKSPEYELNENGVFEFKTNSDTIMIETTQDIEKRARLYGLEFSIPVQMPSKVTKSASSDIILTSEEPILNDLDKKITENLNHSIFTSIPSETNVNYVSFDLDLNFIKPYCKFCYSVDLCEPSKCLSNLNPEI